MLLTVERTHATAESTQGEMFIDGVFECYTLEPRMDRSQGKPYAVPAGTYTYTVAPSLHFGRNVIRIAGIPGFDNIEVHPGNFPSDTHGCCLVGSTQAANFVGRSDAEFDDLLGKIVPVGLIQYIDPEPAGA